MIAFLQIIAGLGLLVAGGEALVRGAVVIAARFGLPPFIIGLTIVAYGTSSPEMAISVLAALAGHPDIAFGNVVGSNISNVLLVLGLSTLVYPIAIIRKVALRDTIVMLAATLLLWALALQGMLGMLSALVFLGGLVLHTFYIFYCHKKGIHTVEELAVDEDIQPSGMRLWVAVVACIAGAGLLAFGGHVLVEGAVTFAKALGVAEATIGVTIVALGGSMPELTASMIAAFHKKSDIALGNVIGSNIVNIFGVLGVTSLVAPVGISAHFLTLDIPLMVAATAALLACVMLFKSLHRIIGFAFCGVYGAYIVYLFV